MWNKWIKEYFEVYADTSRSKKSTYVCHNCSKCSWITTTSSTLEEPTIKIYYEFVVK